MHYLIGVDLGTQATKASLCDEKGSLLAEAAAESHLIYPEPGAVEQDPEEMLRSVLDTVKEVLEKSKVSPSDVAGVGIDGQMAGLLAVEASGMAAIPYDSWLDTRCGKSRKAFLDFGEERTIELTGAPVTYAHGPKIVWWRDERPEAYKRVHKFTQPGPYCAMRLCGISGEDAFIDHTYLHFSGFADTARKQWSGELVEGIGIDASKLPRILRPWDKIGGVTAEMAAKCGLKQGTPVVAGCGDSAASTFGAGIVRSGLMIDVAGTASILACAVNVFAPDKKHKTIMFAPSVVEGLYTPMAYINGGGMCIKWFRDDVTGGRYSYRELDEMASSAPPGSENLIFLPHFSGRVCPNDTLVRGSYVNLTWKHGTAHMFRAIMEGIAYEYGIYSDIINELAPGQKYDIVIGVGGGSKSELFTQIKADVLGTPFSRNREVDTAALACCAITGYGVGLYGSLTQLVSTPTESVASPDRELYDTYKARKEIYGEIFGALHGVYSKLLSL
jgi:xylulokinase